MKKSKLLLMLSMFVILMTVFGNVFAQDSDQPAFKVSSIVTDTEMVLSTKNFPADTDFIISMAAEDAPDAYTKVSKFNSRTGGNLNVKVKIGDKFKGLNTIYIMLEDSNGMIYRGLAENIPEEKPVVEEPAADTQISLVNQDTKPEELPVEEPAEKESVEETVVEEPAADTQISLVNQDTKPEESTAEESVEKESVEEPAIEEPVEKESVEESVEKESVEKPVEQAAAEEPIADEQEGDTVIGITEDSAVPVTAEEPAAEIPVLVCDFSIIPAVSIDSVVKNDSVTFTTANFPANSSFTVSMGYYVSTWVPERYPMPPHHHHPAPRPHHDPVPVPPADPLFYVISQYDPKPVPHFEDKENWPHRPSPAPRGYVTSSFSGTAVGTFETGDGTPQTLTFNIPESLKNVNPIALWISDNGPCGFYSYNYFYNNSTL